MSDLKMFRIDGQQATEISGTAMALEKPLQTLIEHNMEAFFGAHLIASEYSTGKKHAGRIDSLGLDENGSPVIFEYKRATNQNVINQGLFYLDWLLDHRGEFQLLVQQRLGKDAADSIDWSNPRLVCVAGDFTRYDEHAVLQINRSIELDRYRDYGGTLLALELLTSTEAKATAAGTATIAATVVKKVTQAYYAYRRLKNFACVEVHPQSKKLLLYVKATIDEVTLEPGFTRDVTNIGHFGTGNLEITIDSADDLERAASHISASYEGN